MTNHTAYSLYKPNKHHHLSTVGVAVGVALRVAVGVAVGVAVALHVAVGVAVVQTTHCSLNSHKCKLTLKSMTSLSINSPLPPILQKIW